MSVRLLTTKSNIVCFDEANTYTFKQISNNNTSKYSIDNISVYQLNGIAKNLHIKFMNIFYNYINDSNTENLDRLFDIFKQGCNVIVYNTITLSVLWIKNDKILSALYDTVGNTAIIELFKMCVALNSDYCCKFSLMDEKFTRHLSERFNILPRELVNVHNQKKFVTINEHTIEKRCVFNTNVYTPYLDK